MRVLIVGDVHWSQYTSILRKRNEYHSLRLDNLIFSVNWAEERAALCNCSVIIYLGDFFDSNHLCSEEISALQHIRWAPCSHIFLTGNHETNVSNLEYSTADLFSLCPNSRVIAQPESYKIEDADCEFCFLPYILERDRKPLCDYFKDRTSRRIIFSHNDLKDINYGNFVSPEGFEISDIHANCDLFINGHIHHYNKVTDKIINSGNLDGQNFTENENYKHGVIVLDTDTLTTNYIDNPYAIFFRKLDCTKIKHEAEFENLINSLSGPHVLTIKVNEEFSGIAKSCMKNTIRPNILEYRLIVERSKTLDYNMGNKLQEIDHLEQFKNYVHSKIGDTKLIEEELAAVCS